MIKHTPGPWKVSGCEMVRNGFRNPMVECGDADEPVLCEIIGQNPPFQEKMANARLIVAAVNSCFQINPLNPLAVAEALPELVEACRAAHKFVKGEINHYPRSVGHLLDAVLAKIGAKGK